jgi:hypothetical protein
MNTWPGTLTADERAKFDKDGYHIVEGLFSRDEAREYRNKLNATFDLPTGDNAQRQIGTQTHTLADGITKLENFWPVIFNDRLLSSVRTLLGDDIRYTQHSDLHINLPGGRYHRDNACREFGVGPDWDETDETYKVVRIAIYLSDHDESGSSLVILPGTHRRESRIMRREYVTWNQLRSVMRRHGHNDRLPHLFFSSPKRVIKTRPGDCAIFDQRLMHAGGVLRGPKPKYAMYLSYGVDNSHSRNHRAFFLNRPTYSPTLPDELEAKLKVSGLLLD